MTNGTGGDGIAVKETRKLTDREIELAALLVNVVKNVDQAFPGNGEGLDDESYVEYIINKLTFDVDESDQLKIVNKMRTLKRGKCLKRSEQQTLF